MCGLGVILAIHDHASRTPEAVIPEPWVRALDGAVRHRGPHGSGVFRDRSATADGRTVDVAIVHRRLSIIDHADGGQPMVSESPVHAVDLDALRAGRGRVAVAFNGHIVNYEELRAELESLGHVFASDHADTEVLIHGWRAWGEQLHARLVGMHAVAVWDAAAARVWLARDRFGEKPLYMSTVAGRTTHVACSCVTGIRAVHAEADAHIELDSGALREWAAMGHDAVRTPWRGLRQLTPGTHTAMEGPEPGYSSHAAPAREPASDERSVASTIGAYISAAVHDRLDADVPVGCLLSSGVDSALVASYAAEYLRDRGETLTALTVRMPDTRYDESDGAREIAEHIGAEHVVVDADADNAADDVVRLIGELGLPLGDSSLLPTYWVCKAAAKRVGVALSGDGGDELFMGYERYQASRLMRGMAGLLFGTVRFDAWLPRTDPKSKWAKLARLSEAARHAGYRDLLAVFPTPLGRQLFKSAPIDAPSADPCTPRQARAYDLAHTLPGDYLRKTDHASMSAGIELRAPLLDPRVADAALALGDHALTPGGARKGLLRALARTRLLPKHVDQPKMGFAVPIGTWLRTDFGGLRSLANDLLRTPDPFAGIVLPVDTASVHRLLDEHDAGRADHGQRIYALTALALWTKSVRHAN